MKRLAILISAPSVPDAQEALDDTVATIAAGATHGRHTDPDGTRVQFAWHDREDAQERVIEEVAELLRGAWECGLDVAEVSDAAFKLALAKIRGRAA